MYSLGHTIMETVIYPLVGVVKVVLPLFGHEGEVISALEAQRR